MAAYVDVIVFHKDELVGELGSTHHFGDLLEHAFTGLVARMRFAGEDKLDRGFRIVDHGSEALEVFEDQIGAFIGSKAAGKADGKRVRTEHLPERGNGFRRFSAANG